MSHRPIKRQKRRLVETFSRGFVTGVFYSVVLTALTVSQGLEEINTKPKWALLRADPRVPSGSMKGALHSRCLFAVSSKEPWWECRQGVQEGWWAARNNSALLEGCSRAAAPGLAVVGCLSLREDRKSTILRQNMLGFLFKKWGGYAIFVIFFLSQRETWKLGLKETTYFMLGFGSTLPPEAKNLETRNYPLENREIKYFFFCVSSSPFRHYRKHWEEWEQEHSRWMNCLIIGFELEVLNCKKCYDIKGETSMYLKLWKMYFSVPLIKIPSK